MTAGTVYEVLEKLIGRVDPQADAAIDGKRLENLEVYIKVFDMMHIKIDDIAYQNKDTKFGSVKPFVDLCNKQLDSMGIKED